MKIFKELKQLGWSDELIAAVGAVAGKVQEVAVDQSLSGVSGPFISSMDYDSISVTLDTRQLLDTNVVTFPTTSKKRA